MNKHVFLFAAVAVFSVLSAGVVMAVGNGWSGYNYQARIFVGTGYQWCNQKLGWNQATCDSFLGVNAPDKLVMKWTADWDRGNAEGWTGTYPGAWTDNEWNGKGVPNGSDQVWHYKIVWVGSALENSPYWRPGGYAIWGQFEVLMDQGTDPALGHTWFAKATPNGYGGK